MTRNEKILALCNLKGKGLEIGPSFNPVLPKASGYDIETLDHATKDELIKKYTAHNVPIHNIEDVDYIWHGGSYTDAIGKNSVFDYIIASHVIEHTTDIIGFFHDCMHLLKPDGILSLVIPDKRRCFDFFRPVSTVANAINSYLTKPNRHDLGTTCEHFLNAAAVDGSIAFGLADTADMALVHNYDEVNSIINVYNTSPEYIDIHHWVFTKASFELLIYDLQYLGYLPVMRIAHTFDTEGIEFFVSIQKSNNLPLSPNSEYRLSLLLRIERELSQASHEKKFGDHLQRRANTHVKSLQRKLLSRLWNAAAKPKGPK